MDTHQLLDMILEGGLKVARTEIARVLIEPQRQIVTLLNNRSADMAELEQIVAEIDERTLENANYGKY